jgi:hypothetical protein
MRKYCCIVAVLAVSLAASTAFGQLTREQQKCQKTVGSKGGAFFKKIAATLQKCHNDIAKGNLPPATDCLLEVETAAKIVAAENKLTTNITDACPNAVVASLVFGGQCNGSATAAALATCLIQTHEDEAIALVDTAYGTAAVLNRDQQGCQKFAAKSGLTFAGKQHSLLRSCENKIGKGTLPVGTDCTATAAAKLAKSHNKSSAKIAEKCFSQAISGLAFNGACAGASTGATLATCILRSHSERDEQLITIEYGGSPTGDTALAMEIADTDDCVDGPISRCRLGDFLLENGRVRVVVQDVQRNMFGIGQYGGHIIDADLVRMVGSERDNFEEVATLINLENTAHYTTISVLNDGSDGAAAVIRVTGVDDLIDFLNPSSTVAGLGFLLDPFTDDNDLPIEIMTDYILRPGRSYVQVETTIQNIGGSGYSIFFGDLINGSGEVTQFQPAYGFGEPLVTVRCGLSATSPCNAVIYQGYNDAAGVSYGFTSDDPQSSAFTTSGVSVPLMGTEVLLALTGMAGPPHALTAMGSPGDSKTFTRYLIVGDGTVSSILDTRNEIQFIPNGTLQGNITAGGSPAVNAQVAVLRIGGGPGLVPLAKNVVSHTLTDAAGNYSLTIPPGDYSVMANHEGYPFEGGGSSPLEHAVLIEANEVTLLDIALPATGTLDVTAVDESSDPIAAKVSVIGIDPSPDPRNTQNILGLITNTTGIFNDLQQDGLPYGLSHVHFAGLSGTAGPMPLEPGSYRVVVSHGTEYSAYSEDIVVTANATSDVDAQIAPIVDSSNLISGDFHVHSIDSPDSQTSRVDRVVSMIAEGVDFFTPSDHDFRTDFSPTVSALGATSLIKTAVSAEMTTFDYGHFNAWPVPIDPAQVNGGSVDFGGAAPDGMDFPAYGNYSLTPGEIIDAVRTDGATTVQINHVHSFFGLGGGSGLAIDTGVEPPQSAVSGAARRLNPAVLNYFPAAPDRPDALEIWIGDDRGQITNNLFGRNLGDWFNLLNQGIITTGLANSDTHRRIITQSGMPRNMIASATDDPSAIVPADASTHLNEGRSFGTNGPILRVSVEASSTGDTGSHAIGDPTLITTLDGEVDVEIEVESPLWAEFDRIELYINSTTTKTTSMAESGSGLVTVTRYSVTPDVVLDKDTDFTVTEIDDFPAIPGAKHLETTATVNLMGLTDDIWIVAVVRGTDNVSKPLFPVVPNSMLAKACNNNPCRSCTTDANCTSGGVCTVSNQTTAELIDGNLNQCGMNALAFANPLYVDVDGGGWTAPGVQVAP